MMVSHAVFDDVGTHAWPVCTRGRLDDGQVRRGHHHNRQPRHA